jgi:hypothetical protein
VCVLKGFQSIYRNIKIYKYFDRAQAPSSTYEKFLLCVGCEFSWLQRVGVLIAFEPEAESD